MDALNCYDVLIGVTVYMVIVDCTSALKAVVHFGRVHRALLHKMRQYVHIQYRMTHLYIRIIKCQSDL